MTWALLLLPLQTAALSQPQARPPAQYPDYYKVFLQHETEGFLTRVVLPNLLPVVVEEHPSIPLAALVTALRLDDAPEGKVDLALAAEVVTRRLDQRLRVRGGWSEWDLEPGRLEIRTILPAAEILHGVEGHLEIWSAPDPAVAEWLLPVAGWRLDRFRRRFPVPWGKRILDEATGGADSTSPAPAGSAAGQAAEAYRRRFRPEFGVLAICGTVRHEVVLRKLAEPVSGNPAAGSEEAVGVVTAPRRPGPGERAAALPQAAPAGTAAESRAAPGATGPVPEGPSGFRYALHRGEPGSPAVVMGFRVPPSGHPDRLPLEVVRCLLAEGESAYLKLPRGEEPGSPFAVRSGYAHLGGQDLLLFVLRPQPELLERAEVRLLGALEALRSRPVPGLLLKRAQAWLVTSHLRRLETLPGRAAELARWELAGDYRQRDRYPSAVAAVKEVDLRRVIAQYLELEQLTLVEFVSETAEPREFTPEVFLDTLKILLPPEAAAEAGVLESLRGEVAPYQPPRVEPNFADVELRRSSILRGPEVFVRELHTVPLVDLAFFYPGGRPAESTDRVGVTEVLVRALVRHLARVEGGRRWLELEAAGAQIRPEVEPDYFGFHLLVPSQEMGKVFRQVMEWLKSGPRPGEVELKEALRELEAEVWLDGRRCTAWRELLRRGSGAVFGNHPYGLDGSGCGGLPALSLELVENWRATLVQGVYPHVLAVGDVNGTSFLQDQIPLLSDRSFRTGRLSIARAQTSAQPVWAESAGGLAAGTWAGPRVGADEVEILDVAAALADGPSGRLSRSLAEGGVAGSAWLTRESWVAGGLLHLVLLCRPDQQEEGRRLVLEAVRGLAEANVPDSEFLSALVRTITRYTHLQHDRDNYLRETMTAILADEPIDYARRYVLNIRQMRWGEIETAVRRTFGEGR
jgi:predicted Zn-dependent peptidase